MFTQQPGKLLHHHKFYIVLVLLLAFTITTKVLASLTFSDSAITGNSARLELQDYTVNEGTQWLTNAPSGGNQQISVGGTLDATTSADHTDIAGGVLNWITAGTNSNIDGLMLQLQPGFTGNHTVRVIDAQSYVAGSSLLNIQDMSGTVGVASESQGRSTGDNIGLYSIAGFAAGKNIAGFFRAFQDGVVPGTNIGVLSVAGHYSDNYSPTPTAPQISGYFSLGAYYDVRPNLATSSAALIADNGNMTTVPIFIGRVTGVNAFQITGTGGLLDKPSTDSTTMWQVQNAAGNTFFDLDSTNQRVGIGNAAPQFELDVDGTINATALKINGVNVGISSDSFWTPVSGGISYTDNVGIGTSTPAGPLDVNGKLTVLSTGNVGIGTANPARTLDIQAATATQEVKSTTGTNNVFTKYTNTSGALYVGNESSAGGSILPGSTAYAGIINQSGALPLQFGTNNNLKMTILSAGNVGIGTTNPGQKLEVVGNILASGTVYGSNFLNGSVNSLGLGFPTIGGQVGIGLAGAFNSGGQYIIKGSYNNDTTIAPARDDNSNAGDIVIRGGGAERARFMANGNVGIGTTSPGVSNLLELSSTTKGLVLPRMTKAQRDAIATPVAGMEVYQTDNTPGLRVYNGTNWMRFTETAD